jgi:tyrosinase
MGNPDYAAFDPVFFLHHCNVDRLFAIWQAAYPSIYVQPFAEDGGTFTVRHGEVETEASPLTPWRRSDTTFWSSTDCRDVKALNYTYQELEWKLDPVQLRAQMISLYGGKKLVRNFVNTTVAPQQPSGVTQASVSSSASSGAPPKPGYTPPVTAGYPDQPAAGYQAHPPAGYQAQPAAGYPAQPASGYQAQPASGYQAQPASGYQAQPASGYQAQPASGYQAPSDPGYKATPHDPGYKPTTPNDPGYKPTAPTGYQAHPPTTGYQAHPPAGYTRVENHYLQQFREWFALIDVRKNVCGGPFTIHVFLGEVPEDHTRWVSAPNHCGTVNIFARKDDTHCAKCKKDPEVIVGGTVDLTAAMMALGCKLDLDAGKTAAFLKKELKLRVFKYETNQIIDAATLTSLTLRVQTAAVQLDQVADDKIKDSGNGRIAHRVPNRRDWVHVKELDIN